MLQFVLRLSFSILNFIYFLYREEIQSLAKENEQLQEDLKEAKTKYRAEKRNKEKVDRILYDAAEAIKMMLQVTFDFLI